MGEPDAAEALARLRLARTEGVGPKGFAALLARHGSAAAALDALPAEAARRGAPAPAPPSTGEAAREAEALARLGGRLLHLGTPSYPALLAETADPPPVLAVLGDAALLAARQVAVVGARNASANGRRLARDLARDLAAAGLAVTSGLARGVDAEAHAGALEAGRTVAVVAGGLDRPYPPEHAALQARIAAEGGTVVAEAPLGTAPVGRHFPRRNRVVAGLSLGCLVVEAAFQSGTLITARLALEAGRELFAVPGSPLDPRCRGSNDLLRQGAHLTETAEDVLANLPAAPRPFGEAMARARAPRGEAPALPAESRRGRPDDGDAAQVLELLGASPVAVDDLLRRCHLSGAAVRAVLLDLELAGRIEALPGNRVVLV